MPTHDEIRVSQQLDELKRAKEVINELLDFSLANRGSEHIFMISRAFTRNVLPTPIANAMLFMGEPIPKGFKIV
jgi:hypothetical protein